MVAVAVNQQVPPQASYIPDIRIRTIIALKYFLFLFDFFLVIYIFLFSTDRQAETGLYQALLVQFPILLTALILIRLEFILTRRSILKYVTENAIVKKKTPLFHGSTEQAEIKSRPALLSLMEQTMKFLVLSDLLLMSILYFYGTVWQDVLSYAAIAYQAYFIPPLLIIYIISTHQRFYINIDEKYLVDINQFRLIKRLRKSALHWKSLALVGLIILLLASSLVVVTYVNDEFHEERVTLADSIGEAGYVNFNLMEVRVDENEISTIGEYRIANQFGREFPELRHIVHDTSGEITSDTLITKIGRVNETIVDYELVGDIFRFLLINDDFFFLKFAQYSLTTGIYEELAIIDLSEEELREDLVNPTVYGHFFVWKDETLYLFEVPFESRAERVRDEQLLNSQLREYNVETDEEFFYILDFRPIDAMFHNDELHILSFSENPRPYFNHSVITKVNGSYTNNNPVVLEAPIPEKLDVIFSPNGASLVELDGDIYYRSTLNLYSITNNVGIPAPLSILSLIEYFLSFNQVRGLYSHEGRLVLLTDEVVYYLDPTTFEILQTANALKFDFTANLILEPQVVGGSVVTADISGDVYYWPGDPQVISTIRNLTQLNISLSFIAALLGAGIVSLAYLLSYREITKKNE